MNFQSASKYRFQTPNNDHNRLILIFYYWVFFGALFLFLSTVFVLWISQVFVGIKWSFERSLVDVICIFILTVQIELLVKFTFSTTLESRFFSFLFLVLIRLLLTFFVLRMVVIKPLIFILFFSLAFFRFRIPYFELFNVLKDLRNLAHLLGTLIFVNIWERRVLKSKTCLAESQYAH